MADEHERVVLARRTTGFQPFQWSGAEPDEISDTDEAVELGAQWEGDELVTYDLAGFRLAVASQGDDFLNDND